MNVKITTALLAGAASIATPAFAQLTGASHPDQLPITTSPAATTDSTVYLPYTPKPSAAVPVAAVPTEPTPTLTASITPILITPDTDANIVLRVPGPSNQLPIGTALKFRIRQDLSTKTTTLGTPFTAELIAPLLRDGRVLLPAGSTLTGRVTEVHGGRRISGQASMHLMPQRVTLPDGTIYPLQAQLIDTDLYKSTKVDPEGTILRKGSKTGTAAGVGLSTGAGAASGAIFGGWPGAIIGAGIGAGVSTVVWLKQDRQTELPQGTAITFQLTQPILIDGK